MQTWKDWHINEDLLCDTGGNTKCEKKSEQSLDPWGQKYSHFFIRSSK